MTQNSSKQKKKHAGQYKKGVSGNPKGRPKLPGEIKTAKVVNQIEMFRIMNKFAYMSTAEIKNLLHASDTPMIEIVAARLYIEAGKKGDHHRLGFVFDRLIGSVPQRTEHSFHDSMVDFIKDNETDNEG